MLKIQAASPEAQSANVVQEITQGLKLLIPQAFTEGNIDFDVLKEFLGEAVDEREEKYGLNWHGKRRCRQSALKPSTGTLRPCSNESDSPDWNTTRNLFIEGDNLEILKLLQKSYHARLRLIYIDPPYNTGNDFIYPDDFTESLSTYLQYTGQVDSEGRKFSNNTEASGRFHSKWLSMMYPRLFLARNLLRNDGVLLISIDDNELSNLRKICDEIFGEENFIACLVWEKGRKNDAKLFSVGHEYILVYAKSLSFLRDSKVLWREEKPGAREIWEKYLELRTIHGTNDGAIETDLQQWYSSLPKAHPSKKWSRYKRVDANGPWRDRDISWPGSGGPRYDVLHPVTKKPCTVPEAGWRFATQSEMQRQIELGLVAFRDDHSEPPFRKAHIRPIPAESAIDELDEEIEQDDDSEEGEADEQLANQVRGSYFYKQSQVTVKHLRSLFGAKVFDNPKDHVELAKLFAYVTNNDPEALVMDFFAGSGTTAHSVLELNAADNGNRNYILVQLPEPLDPTNKDQKSAAKYCEKIGRPLTIAELTKERLRLAAKAIRSDHPNFDGDLGFRVFKLDSSNILAWEPDPDDLSQSLLNAIEHLNATRSDEDILFELLLKWGLDLSLPIDQKSIAGKTVYSIGIGALLVCLDEHVTNIDVESLALGITEWHAQLAPAVQSTCVFRDSAFTDDVAKTNLTAILQQNGIKKVCSL